MSDNKIHETRPKVATNETVPYLLLPLYNAYHNDNPQKVNISFLLHAIKSAAASKIRQIANSLILHSLSVPCIPSTVKYIV